MTTHAQAPKSPGMYSDDPKEDVQSLVESERFNELRDRAEVLLQKQGPRTLKDADNDIKKLIHELNVNQIELELQNEELAEAQTKLEASRDKYLQLFDFAPIGYFSLSKSGLIRETNLSGSEMLGVERRHLSDRPFLTYVENEHHGRFSEHISNVLENDYPRECELKLRTRWGKPMFVHMRSQVVLGTNGNVAGIFTAMADITSRKMAEEKMENQRKLLQSLLLAIPTPVFYLGFDHVFLGCNKAFADFVGKSIDDVVGTTVFDFWPEKNAEQQNEKDLDLLMRQGSISYECTLPDADGKQRWLVVNKSTFTRFDGSVGGVVGTMTDITERKQTMEELKRAKEAAESASLAKGRFLANMSHEIRTPLNGILGFTELTLNSGLDKDQRANLEMVRESGQALLHILNDILDFSKIEAGKINLVREAFNLRQYLDSAVKMFRIPAARKSLNLAVSIAPETPVSLIGDPLRLRQVLINLVGNAVKFTEAGSIHVNVMPDPTYVKNKADDMIGLKFQVMDTGCGIPEEKVNVVFDSFSQVDEDLSRKFEGTGLGLAISKKLVELMNGNISVESTIGKGSTFTFTAQFEVSATEEINYEDISAPRAKSISGMNILLAEDNKVNQFLAQRILEKQGCRVTCVGNGREALEALAEEEFDAVLMDIQMPEMDGVEATREIRNAEATHFNPKIPVIALTAHAMKGDKERFMAAGMDDYLAKPLDQDKLVVALSKFL